MVKDQPLLTRYLRLDRKWSDRAVDGDVSADAEAVDDGVGEKNRCVPHESLSVRLES